MSKKLFLSLVMDWRKARIFCDSRLIALCGAIGLFAVFAFVYLRTAARLPTGYADSDDLLVASYFGTAAHPPGYPLLVIILHGLFHFFSWIPPVQVANFFTALIQAANVGLLFWLFYIIEGRFFAAFVAAAFWGLSTLTWLHGTVIEAFPLATLLLLVALLAALQFGRSYRLHWWGLFIFFGGLAFLQHQLTGLIAGPVFLLLLFLSRKNVSRRQYVAVSLLTFVIVIVSGLLVYWFVARPTHYQWGLNYSLSGLWRFFWRLTYAPHGSAIEAYTKNFSIDHALYSLGFYGHLLKLSWGVAVVFLGMGVFACLKSKLWGPLLLWLFTAGFLVVYLRFPIREAVHDTEFFWGVALRWRMFFAATIVEAFLLFKGLGFLFNIRSTQFSLMAMGVAAMVLVNFGYGRWADMNSSESNFTHFYTERILMALPQNSLLIIEGDLAFTFLYQQLVGGVRQDVLLMPATIPVSQRVDELYQIPDEVSLTARQIVAITEALREQRRVFFYAPDAFLLQKIGAGGDPLFVRPYGYVLEVGVSMPEESGINDYGLTKQVTDIPASAHSFWYAGERAHLGSVHAMIGYYLARAGVSDAAVVHTTIALDLSDSRLTRTLIQQNLQEALEAFRKQESYANYLPTMEYYEKQYQEALNSGNVALELLVLEKQLLLAPQNTHKRLQLVSRYRGLGREAEALDHERLLSYYEKEVAQ